MFFCSSTATVIMHFFNWIGHLFILLTLSVTELEFPPSMDRKS